MVIPSTDSGFDGADCASEDDDSSLLEFEESERRRGAQTPRSGLSLFLVRLSVLSPIPEPWKSLLTNFSSKSLLDSPSELTCPASWLETWSLNPDLEPKGRGGRLPFSEVKIWILCCAVDVDWLWRDSLFRSMLLINLPPASRLWFCFEVVGMGETIPSVAWKFHRKFIMKNLIRAYSCLSNCTAPNQLSGKDNTVFKERKKSNVYSNKE